jgi:hypothetical protein
MRDERSEYYDDPEIVTAMVRGCKNFEDAEEHIREYARRLIDNDQAPKPSEPPPELTKRMTATECDAFFGRMVWQQGWLAGWRARTGD